MHIFPPHDPGLSSIQSPPRSRVAAWMDIGQLRALSLLSVRATGAIDCALHCGAAAKRREGDTACICHSTVCLI